jgi:cyclase
VAGVRVIPRLDIKGPNLVKGIHLEGLRVLGKPEDFARRYSAAGADELIYIDIVASLYQRNSLLDIVERTAAEIFVPLTVGGGIRSTDDIAALLRAGADKVAINTAATARPAFISEAARMFGSQCVVLSIEAKRQGPTTWEAYTDNGRERSGRDAIAWALEGVALGAGEILVTSVDQEGTGRGYDLDLTKAIATQVSVPVIACGGAGSDADVVAVVREGRADAVALARLLHYGDSDITSVKTALASAGVEVRA